MAYESLKQNSQKPLIVLLSYDMGGPPKGLHKVANSLAQKPKPGKIRLAIVGAGGFAKGTHLPNIQKLSNFYAVQAIMSRSGHNAAAAARQFGAAYSTTDYDQILKDSEIDAVLIATRHHLHSKMAIQAFYAGKHVLVEKPLAIHPEELKEIRSFFENDNVTRNTPLLMTGFNRRFSIYAKRIHEIVSPRKNPMIINYRMNAGYIPMNHWVHSEEGGGRNVGEACHIYDLFTYLTNSKIMKVDAHSIVPKGSYYSRRDNFVATMTWEDGSVTTLTYTALGSPDYPKEQMEIYVEGKVVSLNNYQELMISGAKIRGIQGKTIDKGQKEELEVFAQAIKNGEQWPIPLWQQIQATEISFEVEKYL